MTLEVLAFGWMVTVAPEPVSFAVVVAGSRVERMVLVEVVVVLTTGVDISETVTVGVTVVVCCGPTVREKSRS